MALMPVAEALRLVLADAKPLPAEVVTLDQATGRVLTLDVAALRTQPPTAVSAMDGYAVRASDGMAGRLLRRKAGQQLEHRGPVPRLALERSPELLVESADFRGHSAVVRSCLVGHWRQILYPSGSVAYSCFIP